MTSTDSTIGYTDTDYESYNEIIACDWCDNLYKESSYCEYCGPVLSNNQIADLMRFVENLDDDYVLGTEFYVENVSAMLNHICDKWYDGGDYAYQKTCAEYLARQPRNSKIEKALDFFEGSYEHCKDGCRLSYDRYVGHECRGGSAFDRKSIFDF
jgi:hypothetical protein